MAVKRDKVLKDAEKLVQKGKLEQAINLYEKILRRFKDDTTIINRLGDLHGRVGQVERAVELYEEVADHFISDGFTTKAIAIYKKVQRLDPQRLDIFERLAQLYFDQGLLAEAKREYQILADWYVKNGELEKAIESHERLVDLDPSNHVSALRLADLLLRRGEINSALKVYDRLGKMLLEAEKLDEAERLYRHVLEQNPPQGEFMADVCRVFLDAGRTPLVLEFLEWAVKASPDDPDLKTVLVRTHLTMGENKKAMEIAQQVLEIEPDNTEMRSLVGGAMMSTGEVNEAREMLIPTVEAMLEKGQNREAQAALQDLLQELPNDQDLLRLAVRAYSPSGDTETLFTLKAALAESFYQSENLEASKRLFLEVLEADPENQQFRQRLATLDGVEADYYKPEGAEDTFKEGDVEVIELDDEAAPAGPAKVEAPPAAPTAPEPAPRAETATSADGPAPDSFDLDERLAEAAVFAKYGLVEKAINHLEDVVLFCPDELVPRRRLALLYLEQGDRSQAVAMAEPVFKHHSADGSLDQIADLVDALPELTGAAAPATAAAPAPEIAEVTEVTRVSEVAEVETEEPAQPAAAAAPISGKEFVDEETDLIEVVDIEGELTGAPEESAELEPDVEEYEVDFGPGVGVPDELSAPASIEQSDAQAEAQAAPDLVEEEISEPEPVVEPPAEPEPVVEEAASPPPVEEVVVEEVVVDAPAAPEPSPEPEPMAEVAAPEPASAPAEVVEEEVADELVEITESFVGPSMGDLEQIDFFIDQELYDDAARLLAKLEEEHGEDPEVVGRRLKLKEVGVLLEQVETVEEGSEELFADEEQYIDLAKELEAELAAEEAMVDEATGRGKGEAILEEVFREFQKGVADQLSEEDSDTHFNLGIAYREMGLLPEAIREFQVASRDPSFFVESCSIIGVCYQEQGMWSEAAEWYQKALVAPDISEEARLGLRYDLAAAYEAAGDVDQAFGLFEELHGVDPSYRDVSNRVANLTQHRQAN